MLAKSPDLIDVFIQGSAPDRLLRQVTCGNVGLENAIVIPRSLYPQMLAKLVEIISSELPEDPWLTDFTPAERVQGFLAGRCSAEFLAQCLQHNQSLLDELSDPGQYHITSMIVRLAARLHQCGLLPDQHRKTVVGKASRHLLYGEDCSALNDKDVQSLYTQDELDNLLERVKEELVPSLEDVREALEWDYDRDEDPDEYMQPYLELLDSLQRYLGDDWDIADSIAGEEYVTKEWISHHWPDEPDFYERPLARGQVPTGPEGGRSIFDDIYAAEDSDL